MSLYHRLAITLAGLPPTETDYGCGHGRQSEMVLAHTAAVEGVRILVHVTAPQHGLVLIHALRHHPLTGESTDGCGLNDAALRFVNAPILRVITPGAPHEVDWLRPGPTWGIGVAHACHGPLVGGEVWWRELSQAEIRDSYRG